MSDKPLVIDSVKFKEIEGAFKSLQDLAAVSETIKKTSSFSVGLNGENGKYFDTYYPKDAETIRSGLLDMVQFDSYQHLDTLKKYGFTFDYKFGCD